MRPFRAQHTPRVLLVLAASGALSTASAQNFWGDLAQRWNSPEWQQPLPATFEIPSKGMVERPDDTQSYYAPLPNGPAVPADMGGPTTYTRTLDRFNAVGLPVVQGVQNAVAPLPGGLFLSGALQNEFVNPRTDTFMRNEIPGNYISAMAHLQDNPGAQVYDGITANAAQNGVGVAAGYRPHWLKAGFVEKGQAQAKKNVYKGLGNVALGAGAMLYLNRPSAILQNAPQYLNAAQQYMGGGNGGAQAAPPAAMPMGGAPAADAMGPGPAGDMGGGEMMP